MSQDEWDPSENDARTRGDGLEEIYNKPPRTQPPRPGREAPQPPSSAPRAAWEGPTTTKQRPPAAQRNRRGLGLDRGGAAWLNLEQVASIIQLHNTGRSIVTTLLQGTEREDWDTVWTHMREAEGAAVEGTGGPTTRVGDRLMRHGQLLFRHKQEGISGLYPMNMPGHWRVMIVSHDLRQVLLLDPAGDGFTIDEFDSVKYSYVQRIQCQHLDETLANRRLELRCLVGMCSIIMDDPRRNRSRGHHGHK